MAKPASAESQGLAEICDVLADPPLLGRVIANLGLPARLDQADRNSTLVITVPRPSPPSAVGWER